MTEPALVDNVEVTPAELSAASRTIRLASRAAIYRIQEDPAKAFTALEAWGL